MKAILAFELSLLRGGRSLVRLIAFAVALLVGAWIAGRLLPWGAEVATWLAPLVLLLVLWRALEALQRLSVLIGSLPLGWGDVVAGHLLFWLAVSVVPAIALVLVGFPTDVLLRFVAGFLLLAVPSLAWRRSPTEFLPALTPKRVRVRKKRQGVEDEAVPWRHRRDREGVRRARADNARSPRSTLVHLLAPLPLVWLLTWWGVMAGRRVPEGDAPELLPLLLALLAAAHLHQHFAVPTWVFLRSTPVPSRRAMRWLLLPVIVAAPPVALLIHTAVAAAPEDSGSFASGSWGTETHLVVPDAMKDAWQQAVSLPSAAPSFGHGGQRLRINPEVYMSWRRGLAEAHDTRFIHDEAAYFERIVLPYLRMRFKVSPTSVALRACLGPPMPPRAVGLMAMLTPRLNRTVLFGLSYGGRSYYDFPWGIGPQLWRTVGEVSSPGLAKYLQEELSRKMLSRPPKPVPDELRENLRRVEASVAAVLTETKKDGAVYDFNTGLWRVWERFQGEIQQRYRQRMVLDGLAFVVLLLASLRWGLRGGVHRWLAPLLVGGAIVAWARLAWWPIGTAVYVWSLDHFALVVVALLAAVVLAGRALLRALRIVQPSPE